MRKIPREFLQRSRTDALERLARALKVLPEERPASRGAWRVALFLAIEGKETAIERALEVESIVARGATDRPDIPAQRIGRLVRYLEIGLTAAQMRIVCPWGLSHEMRIARERAGKRAAP